MNNMMITSWHGHDPNSGLQILITERQKVFCPLLSAQKLKYTPNSAALLKANAVIELLWSIHVIWWHPPCVGFLQVFSLSSHSPKTCTCWSTGDSALLLLLSVNLNRWMSVSTSWCEDPTRTLGGRNCILKFTSAPWELLSGYFYSIPTILIRCALQGI